MSLIQILYYKSTLVSISNSNVLAAKNKLKVNKNGFVKMSDICLKTFTANFGHIVTCWILSNCCFFIIKNIRHPTSTINTTTQITPVDKMIKIFLRMGYYLLEILIF